VFQQGDDILAIIELPGLDKNELQIQAKENTIRMLNLHSTQTAQWADQASSTVRPGYLDPKLRTGL
jgi:HSP20 family molecular chaperone IbpA